MTKNPKSALALAEEAQAKIWKEQSSFETTLANRQADVPFVFYDGPPFANGLPHWGHMMTSTLKDAVTRYQTMRGHYVPRRFGWDCHGLPPEMLAEKELGVSGKQAIQQYGVDKFNNYCRESVLRFTSEWHDYVERMGRWVDFHDDYRTMDIDYMESVLWAFKQLHEKGLIYEGERVVPYSYGAQTALSNFETRQDDSYRDREDVTATIPFRLSDGRKLLGWTTTPWTLPANLLLAVNRSIEYVEMNLGDEVVILAKEALERYEDELAGASEQSRFSGAELVGLSYEPLFPYFVGSDNSFRVVEAEFVAAGEGTGIVHIAPGHGEDDYWLGRREKTPIISPVDDAGCFTDEVKDYIGRLVFDANGEILADLDKAHKLFKTETIIHKYPHCWRTDVPIIYRAMSAWFVDVPKIKDQLLQKNQEINWYPEHVKDGSFGKWLENAREWNISRKRFWGAPLPVWKTDDGEVIICGSLEEIRERAVDPSLVTDLHRPNIDLVTLKTDSGKIAHRVEDVFDCWFESGSMPFAQMHYPFENVAEFESQHPADFITEYIGQTRGWFYTLHVMSVALFDKPAFKTAVAHGIILGTDGRKMSKRLGNYPELSDTFDSFGADAVRYYLLSSALFSGDTASFDAKALQEAQRNVIQRFKNVFGFYSMYAVVDGFTPDKHLVKPTSKQVLDIWILNLLEVTIAEVTQAADSYDTPRLCRAITDFLDNLSNWYVRRSRRRFWKSGNDSDKQAAYQTLHFVLARTAQLLAPWAPFVSDEVWRELMAGTDEAVSVHGSDWPIAAKADQAVLDTMRLAREVVTIGLAARAKAGVKVRQPLAQVEIQTPQSFSQDIKSMIAEELNVKKVSLTQSEELLVELDTKLTPSLISEGLARDIIRHVQEARKQAGLQVDDRIDVTLNGDEAICQAVKDHQAFIQTEVLADSLVIDAPHWSYQATVQVNGQPLELSLAKKA
ncbi:isoleucine--tRNA ligase [Candidatus Saccharibacteria bacterium]|nr:isoleucine--tRNA ligase [Candidatus Saccharibacteria bacterium]